MYLATIGTSVADISLARKPMVEIDVIVCARLVLKAYPVFLHEVLSRSQCVWLWSFVVIPSFHAKCSLQPLKLANTLHSL